MELCKLIYNSLNCVRVGDLRLSATAQKQAQNELILAKMPFFAIFF